MWWSGNIRSLIRRRKNSTPEDNNTGSRFSILKGKWTITILGIILTVLGFAGAIYYGSQFVEEETNAGGTLPYTTSSQLKNISPIDLEVGFVVVGVIGFGILIYGIANRVDKPLDFYPQWTLKNKFYKKK